jgi:SAM-dependent methyltransferase
MHQVDFWRDRYQRGETPWDLGAGSPHFRDWLSRHDPEIFPPGKTAVLGCGRGHDAALFAAAGFDVVGFDYAPEAIAEAQRLYDGKVRFEQADIFALADRQSPWAHAFDYVVEHTCFCAIHPSERPAYVQSVATMLKLGGYLLGVFWEHDKTDGPPFSTPENEIKSAFSNDFELLSVETREPVADRSGMERLCVLRRKA